jgi:hypothetical protein
MFYGEEGRGWMLIAPDGVFGVLGKPERGEAVVETSPGRVCGGRTRTSGEEDCVCEGQERGRWVRSVVPLVEA